MEFLSGGAGVSSRGYTRSVADILKAVQKLPTKDFQHYLPSAKPRETVDRYLRSLTEGIGDPMLPLVTQGSSIFRAIVPRSSAQQRRVAAYYERAFPYELDTVGDQALAFFAPNSSNLPIVLQRGVNGLWYVDEPKGWTYFHRFENRTDFFPKYDDLPLLSVLKRHRRPEIRNVIYSGRVRTPLPRPYPNSIEVEIASLESAISRSPKEARLYASLGELYIFEVNWLSKALSSFEKARELDPENLGYHWRLLDLYGNASQVEQYLTELDFLANRLPGDAQVQEWHKFYHETYAKIASEYQ
jgi:hypothetical protein